MSRSKWLKLVQEQKDSGLTMAGFCRAKGINIQTFRKYRSELLKQTNSSKLMTENSTFKEFCVGLQFRLSLDEDGLISIHGIKPVDIPKVLGAMHVVP